MNNKDGNQKRRINDLLSEHTLSDRYLFGYTTSRSLLSQLDTVIIEPYNTTKDEYIYYKNHNIRARVSGATKHVEVPSAILAGHLEKVHRFIGRSDQYRFDVENRFDPPGETIYEKTENLLDSELDAFYNELDPSGSVILCRPEEALIELAGDSVDSDQILGSYKSSSRKYLRRIDSLGLNWEDVHEPYRGIHPRFQEIDQLVTAIREQTDMEVTSAIANEGVLRGYRVELESKTLTLLCRGWGRDISYAIVSRLLEYTVPESVLFISGCGAVQPELGLNEFIIPNEFDAEGEEKLTLDNVFLENDQVTESLDGFVEGTSYCVTSPVVETVEYLKELRDSGNTCVAMDEYGVVKALNSTSVPLGILLFTMDCPLRGVDLGQVSYDIENRKKYTFSGNATTTEMALKWNGVSD